MAFIRKYGTVIFVLLLLVHCLFIYLDIPPLRTLSKLLLLPFLLVYLSASREGVVNPLVVVGLICSFAGDLLLIFRGEVFFLLGMAAFTGTHICNTLFFARLQKGHAFHSYFSMAGMMVFMAALGWYVFTKLDGLLGKLELPVGIYMLVISIMALAAAGTIRNPYLKKAGFFFIPGAALFAVSDTILALNKFLWHQTCADIAVMLTYGVAQYLLVKGFTRSTQLKLI